jgi:integrase
VTGHVIDTNTAHSVRGPRYTVKKGKAPVLTVEEAHALLESIPITKKPANDTDAPDQPDLLGLRDRALIGIMVYSFARIGATIQMKVSVYFVQGRQRWVRLHEKGGKEHDVPCHHRLDECLHNYIEAAGIADDADGYLFRTARRKTGQLTTNFPLPAGRSPHHPPAGESGRHRDADRQPHLPRAWHHCLSKEQRKARGRAADRQS